MGSHLLIDIVGQSMLDSPAVAPMLREFDERRMPWRYGTDRPEDLLAGRGWRPDSALISTVGTQFGRWPYPDQPRGTPGVAKGYLVHARR